MSSPSAHAHVDAMVLKVVGSLLLLGFAFLAAVLLLVSVGALGARQVFGGWGVGQELFSFVGDLTPLKRLAVGAGSAGFGLVALLALVALVRGGRIGARAASLHMLVSDEHGFVVIDSRGIATIATQAAASTRGVVDVGVEVKGNGTSPVRLRVDLGVYPGANVRRVGDETRESVRRTVEDLVGIGVRDVVVAVHVLEPDGLARLLE